ncbi:MAG: hypothetical protein H7Z14_11285 [Anaerolineae bacterium]|nr:hypothetical protein [Phycisphaerae bacterium]
MISNAVSQQRFRADVPFGADSFHDFDRVLLHYANPVEGTPNPAAEIIM